MRSQGVFLVAAHEGQARVAGNQVSGRTAFPIRRVFPARYPEFVRKAPSATNILRNAEDWFGALSAPREINFCLTPLYNSYGPVTNHFSGSWESREGVVAMKKSKRVSIVVAVVLAAIAALAISGCSNYKLDKDGSLKTEWGTVFQYKVDSNWTEDRNDALNDDGVASVYYSSEGGEEFIDIFIENTDDGSYQYSSDSTYADWLSCQEETYSASAADQADWYEENFSDSSYYDPEQADPNNYPDFTNYSMTEENPITADDMEFRVYKMEYTSTYSDSEYAEIKEKNPDFKQSTDNVIYYAILKDGEHDVEIATSDRKLLKNFMKTLEISW